MPGKIPVLRKKPGSAPNPSQDWRSCGRVLTWPWELCSAGKAQGRAGLGPGVRGGSLGLVLRGVTQAGWGPD